MNWFERKIRRYEHRRWTTDDNRRVQPFHWGLEHIGGSPNGPNLGILGTSLGSSVGYITLVHDPAVRAGGFFHVSTYYADVVSQGMTTNHVWEGLRQHVTVDELRDYWAPISPMPYVERGLGAGRNCFLIYGKYDPTMLPELTRQMLHSLRRHSADPRTLELHCGHYSLELPPFSYIAGYRMLSFFLEFMLNLLLGSFVIADSGS